MKFKSNIQGKEVIVRCAADKFLPFALVFGLYVILFGTVSPGGGFQGGVIVSSACLLIYLGHGYKTTAGAVNGEVLRVNEAIGAAFYVILGMIGILLGANFARNVFYDIGKVGDLISAGTITFMSYTVGYKVLTGVGFLLLMMLGMLAMVNDDGEETSEDEKEGETKTV